MKKLVQLIKDRLEGKNTPVITKDDDLNAILHSIDSMRKSYDSIISDYQNEKRRNNLILENINQSIIAINKEKNIISCNKNAEEHFGFTLSEPVSVYKIIRSKTLTDSIDEAIKRNEYFMFDYLKDGEIFSMRLFPVVSEEISLIITIHNVTETRKLSIEKQEFFSNAGHELNTPLSSILGYSELLLGSKKYNSAFIKTINQEAMRMKLLINNMLKISELEENKEIIDTKVNLKTIVQNVVTAAMPKAENKKIELVVNLEDCYIFANSEKITEVVSNLLDNAIKYTDSSGAVTVSVFEKNNKVILKVKDNGIGIPTHALSRVFERFYRVDKGRAKTEGGTGLGLAIVKHICNYYNAPIQLRSKEGLGTEFSIAFRLSMEEFF